MKIIILFILFLILFIKLKENFSSSSKKKDGERCETNPSEIRVQQGDSCKLVYCADGYTPDFKVNDYKGACVFKPTVCNIIDQHYEVIGDSHGFYAYDNNSNCTLNTCDINYNNSSDACKYLRSAIGAKCTTTDVGLNVKKYSSSRNINNVCIVDECNTGYYPYNNRCLFDWSTTNFATNAKLATTRSGTIVRTSITFTINGDNPKKDKLRVAVPLNMDLVVGTIQALPLTVQLNSIVCSMKKNGIDFNPFTFYQQPLAPISKKFNIPTTGPSTTINIQQPYSQLLLDFVPDDSRTLDTYIITFECSFQVMTTDALVAKNLRYSGNGFTVSSATSKKITTGVTYLNADAPVGQFTIKKLITSS